MAERTCRVCALAQERGQRVDIFVISINASESLMKQEGIGDASTFVRLSRRKNSVPTSIYCSKKQNCLHASDVCQHNCPVWAVCL